MGEGGGKGGEGREGKRREGKGRKGLGVFRTKSLWLYSSMRNNMGHCTAGIPFFHYSELKAGVSTLDKHKT